MRIVIIEDNEALSKAISYRLRDRGHATDVLHNGLEAESFLHREGADLVVLDINLPGKSGLDILKSLRARNDGTPVILLTARSETSDRVAGLDLGADDYLVKPFEMDELEARIRALSRRKDLVFGERETIAGIAFDRVARQVIAQGDVLNIPRKELAVLECLLDRRGRIISKQVLTDQVYGIGADVSDTAVEPLVSRLRSRLKAHGVKIKTARGLGYMLETDTK